MAKPIMITLNRIRAYDPCNSGWSKLLAAKGKTKADDEEFPLADILETNDLDDCLWALRCTPKDTHHLWRKFAVWSARQVEHLMEDERSKAALNVAWQHSNGEATDDELAAAWDAARAAAMAAARHAAAGYAAAGYAAWDAVRAAQSEKIRQILIAGEWVE